jgi:hypothetical protein
MGVIVQNIVDDYAWELLQTPRIPINTKTKVLFKTRAAYDRVARAHPLSFPHGLTRQLWSTKPPTLKFFKSLRTPRGKYKKWAVYFQLLEKRGHRAQLYIGVGTNMPRGVRKRLGEYDRRVSLPRFVRLSLRRGYKITHTGLLCWSDIPPVAESFEVRARFLVIESVFTALFYACRQSSSEKYWDVIFPWTRHDVRYEPLCNHQLALCEKIHSEEYSHLTPAELEEVYRLRAENSRQKKREYDPIYKAKRIAEDRTGWRKQQNGYSKTLRERRVADDAQAWRNKTSVYGRRHYAKRLREDPVAFRAKNAASAMKSYNKDPVASAARQRVTKAAIRASKKHYCPPCDQAFDSPSALDKHKLSKKHLKKLKA